MRSDLVFGAMTHASNRFLLAKALATATRKFHRPGTRIQDTTNDVLARFCLAKTVAGINAVQIPATVPLRRSRLQPAIPHKSKSLAIPAMQTAPQALSETLWAIGA